MFGHFNIFGEFTVLSPQQAIDKKFFGPVYHGTTSSSMSCIKDKGFRVCIEGPETGLTVHGYPRYDYGNTGYPPPIHHLGYGAYFTTSLAIAKRFGTGGSIGTFYLNVPRLEIINWGSPNTMMKWWRANGYDAELAKRSENGRVTATYMLTEVLKSKYDAVWYKGKGLYKLLDGDQVIVFDTSRIVLVDKKLSAPGEVGSKVTRKSDGMKGVILKRKLLPEYAKEFWPKDMKYMYEIKWHRGGYDYSISDTDVTV